MLGTIRPVYFTNLTGTFSGDSVQLSASSAQCRLGAHLEAVLEGIVSKRRDAAYRSGRCADWIKVKNPDAPAATRIMEWP